MYIQKKRNLRKKLSMITLSMLLLGDVVPGVITGASYYKTVYAQENRETTVATAKVTLTDADFIIENFEGILTITGLSDSGRQKVLNNPHVLIQPETATAIKAHAFQAVGLVGVELSDQITHIGEYAFANNQIVEFIDGGQVQELGAYALYGNHLTEVKLSAERIKEYALASNDLTSVVLSKATQVETGVFLENSDLQKVEVSTANPPQNLFADNTFEKGNQLVRVVIPQNDQNVSSNTDEVYVVNPITLIVQYKDKENHSFVTDELRKDYEKENLPESVTALDIEGYLLEGEKTQALLKDSIQSNELLVEFIYRRKEKPVIIVSTEKQVVYRPTDSLNTQELLKNVSFYDDLGEKIEPFSNGILDSRIQVVPDSISAPKKEESKTVKVTLTTSGGEDSIELPFEFRSIDLMKEEIIPGLGWLYEDFTYSGDDGIGGLSALGIKKLETNKNLVLPGIHPSSGKPIIRIISNAFQNKEIDTVDFSQLTSLEVIGYAAFMYSRVSAALNIEVAKNLKAIHQYAFFNSDNQRGTLTSFPFEAFSKLERIEDRAFQNNRLRKVSLTDAPNLSHIAISAFQNNKIKELNISALPMLREIGEHAFENNEIEKLALNDLTSLRFIKTLAFYSNALKEVTLQNLPSLQEIYVSAFNANQIENLNLSNLPALKKINDSAFLNNQIKTLDLSQMPNIEELSGFEGNQIKELSFKGLEKLRIIHNYAFKRNNITELAFEDLPALEEIRFQSFIDNPLKTLTFNHLPNFKRINESAFENAKVEEVVFKDLPELTEINGLQRNANLKKVTFENLPKLTKLKGFNNTGIEEVILKDLPQLEVIDSSAFYRAQISNLVLENLPELRKIGYNAFSNNKLTGKLDLTNLSKLEEIDVSAFESNKLTELDVTGLNELKYIRNSAFSYNLFRNIVLKDLPNLEKVENSAFSSQDGGNSLTKAEISNNPKLKYLSGFYYNRNLDRLILEDVAELEEIGSDAFRDTGVPSIDLSVYPKLKKIHLRAFYNAKLISEVLLPPTVEEIGDEAFRFNLLDKMDLSHLTNLKRIGKRAYLNNNTVMETFKLPETAERLELNEEVTQLKSEQLDFSGQNVHLKLNSAKPFKTSGPLVMHFDRASQIEIPTNIRDLDPKNPTVIFIKDMDVTINPPEGILINPALVHVHFEDENGRPIHEYANYEKYYPTGSQISAPSFEGYAISSLKTNPATLANFNQSTKMVTINQVSENQLNTLTFVYREIPPIDSNDYKVTLKRDGNTNYRFHVQTTNLGLTADFSLKNIPLDERNSKFIIQLPEDATERVQDVQFPETIPGVVLSGKPYYDSETKQVIYPVDTFGSSAKDVRIRVQFRFQTLDTPHNKVYKAKAYYVLEDGRRKGPIAESEEFQPWHYNPTFQKYTYERESTGVRVLAAEGSDDKYTNVTLSYDFAFYSTRRLKGLVIEDTLPTYQKWDDATGGPIVAYPEFDSAKNPGWEYDPITHVARYAINKEYLDNYVEETYKQYYKSSSDIRRGLPKLVLDFPKAISQSNIQNRAKATLKINKPEGEDKEEYVHETINTRSITFGTSDRVTSFSKSGHSEYLIPNTSDSTVDHPWRIVFNPTQVRSANNDQAKYYKPII